MKKKSDPCARAQKSYAERDYKRTLENLTRCIKNLTRQIRDVPVSDKLRLRLQLAKVYNFDGLVSLQNRKLKRAITSLEKSKSLLEKFQINIEINNLLGEIHYSMGLISIFQNQANNSIFEQSKKHYLEAGNYDSAIKVKFQLSEMESNLENKLKAYQEIQKLSKKIKDKRSRRLQYARGLLYEGKIMHQIQDEKAMNTLLKAKKEFSKIKYEQGQIETILEIAGLETDKNAEELLLEAMELANKIENKGLLGIILTRLGILSLKSGQFEMGKQRLMEGLKYRTEAGDKEGSAKTLMELARITIISTRNVNDVESAEKLIQQSLNLYKEVDNDYSLAKAHELASTIYTRSGKFKLAVSHAKLGKKLFSKFKDKDAEARILVQLAVAMDGLGAHDEVMPIFKKASKIFHEINSATGVAEVNYLIGFYLIKFDKMKSIEYLKISLDQYDELKETSKEMQMMYNMIKEKIEELII